MDRLNKCANTERTLCHKKAQKAHKEEIPRVLNYLIVVMLIVMLFFLYVHLVPFCG